MDSSLPEDIFVGTERSKQKLQKFLEGAQAQQDPNCSLQICKRLRKKVKRENFNFEMEGIYFSYNQTNCSANREDIQRFLWRLKDWDFRFFTVLKSKSKLIKHQTIEVRFGGMQ